MTSFISSNIAQLIQFIVIDEFFCFSDTVTNFAIEKFVKKNIQSLFINELQFCKFCIFDNSISKRHLTFSTILMTLQRIIEIFEIFLYDVVLNCTSFLTFISFSHCAHVFLIELFRKQDLMIMICEFNIQIIFFKKSQNRTFEIKHFHYEIFEISFDQLYECEIVIMILDKKSL